MCRSYYECVLVVVIGLKLLFCYAYVSNWVILRFARASFSVDDIVGMMMG